MQATEAEKRALRLFTDWHVDEVTSRRRARDYYGKRLLTRLRQAGVQLGLIGLPEGAIATKTFFEARMVFHPATPETSGYSVLTDEDDGGRPVIEDTQGACLRVANRVIKGAEKDKQCLVIARVEVTYFKP